MGARPATCSCSCVDALRDAPHVPLLRVRSGTKSRASPSRDGGYASPGSTLSSLRCAVWWGVTRSHGLPWRGVAPLSEGRYASSDDSSRPSRRCLHAPALLACSMYTSCVVRVYVSKEEIP